MFLLGGLGVFVFGACIGSFLNVCIYRIPKNISIVSPRSFCPSCKKTISWYDNIPLVSYMLLKGRCRHCGATISFQYWIIEFLNALLYLLLFVKWGIGAAWGGGAFFVSMLLVIACIDIHTFHIYDAMNGGLLAGGILFGFLYPACMHAGTHWAGLFRACQGAAVGAGVLFALRIVGKILFRKEAMGTGDIFLASGIGAFLGWLAFLEALFIAALVGSVMGIVVRAVKKQEYIPFGPFLALGAIIMMLYGGYVTRLFE